MHQFENEVGIVIKDGSTGEVKSDITLHNAISDDFLVDYTRIYQKNTSSLNYLYCFVLPDGPLWSGFTWDKKNPWAPYTLTKNRTEYPDDNNVYKLPSSKTVLSNKTKLFYQWTSLPNDISLKAGGITGISSNTGSFACVLNAHGIYDNVTQIIPKTLLILPTAINVLGHKGGLQTPDVLEVSYYFSLS